MSIYFSGIHPYPTLDCRVRIPYIRVWELGGVRIGSLVPISGSGTILPPEYPLPESAGNPFVYIFNIL